MQKIYSPKHRNWKFTNSKFLRTSTHFQARNFHAWNFYPLFPRFCTVDSTYLELRSVSNQIPFSLDFLCYLPLFISNSLISNPHFSLTIFFFSLGTKLHCTCISRTSLKNLLIDIKKWCYETVTANYICIVL